MQRFSGGVDEGSERGEERQERCDARVKHPGRRHNVVELGVEDGEDDGGR